MNTKGLHKLAIAIGWQKVNEENNYVSYEYKRRISLKESVVNVVRVYSEVTTDEFLETLYILKKVLPKKLIRMVDKVTKNLKPEDISGALDAVCFAIEEYKSKCEFIKLKEYGELLGVNLNDKGYSFQYELSRRTINQILTLIESKLPMNLATKLAKIKKIEYKIGFVKCNKNLVTEI